MFHTSIVHAPGSFELLFGRIAVEAGNHQVF
jgi:hypothetical protein